MSVNKGKVDLSIECLNLDSSVAVHTGDVTLRVPLKTPFKFRLSAPMTNIEPQLQNSGEFNLSKESGNEIFTTEDSTTNRNIPVLSVVVHQGTINVAVSNRDNEKSLGYDSVKNSD